MRRRRFPGVSLSMILPLACCGLSPDHEWGVPARA
jgi:hypothetical protein